MSEELIEVSRGILDAIRNREGGALDRLLASDFQYVESTGARTDREEFISAILEAPHEIRALGFERIDVTPMGDSAMVTGVQIADVSLADGSSATSKVAFADLFVRRDGSWVILFAYAAEL